MQAHLRAVVWTRSARQQGSVMVRLRVILCDKSHPPGRGGGLDAIIQRRGKKVNLSTIKSKGGVRSVCAPKT